ncbi:MAG: GNAT family N-acetyltransferase [Isosphaeraceae bacterium]
MNLEVSPVPGEETLALRELHRHEMHCQMLRDSWHERGWTDSYLLRIGGRVVGYGLVGGIGLDPRDIVVEFYVLPASRGRALPLFRRLIEASGARTIETQSNDLLLTLMLFDCAQEIRSDVVLFRDAIETDLAAPPGATFRGIDAVDRDRLVAAGLDADAGWMIEADGSPVAAGGLLFHYNPPYGDIYMETAGSSRRRGYGSYLVQELKRACYRMGKIPSARCDATNDASRATLQKAGMHPCARKLVGLLKPD